MENLTIYELLEKTKPVYLPSTLENDFQYTLHEDDHRGRSKELSKFMKELTKNTAAMDELYSLQMEVYNRFRALDVVDTIACNNVIYSFLAKEYGVLSVHIQRLQKCMKANSKNDFFSSEYADSPLVTMDMFAYMLNHIEQLTGQISKRYPDSDYKCDIDVVKKTFGEASKEEKKRLSNLNNGKK